MQVVKTLFFILFFLCFQLGFTQTLIQDINDVIVGSRPHNLVSSKNHVYFVADSDEYGKELFRTDGQTTEIVKDLSNGERSTDIYRIHNFEDHLLVFLKRDKSRDVELWKIIHDNKKSILLRKFPSLSRSYATEEALYFFTATQDRKVKLWKILDTKESLHEMASFNHETYPRAMIYFEGAVYFSMRDEDYDEELWKSDENTGITARVKDINPDGNSSPQGFTIFQDQLFFTAYDNIHGVELWTTDGTETGTKLFKDINLGSNSSAPSAIFVVEDKMYFRARTDSGDEPWISDGTESGTYMIKNINTENGRGSDPLGFIEMNEIVYFSAYTPQYSRELWRTDGTTSGTYIVKDINSGVGYSVNGYGGNSIVVNDRLYFRVQEGGGGRFGEIWETDGTAAGTVKVSDEVIDRDRINTFYFTALKDEIFFKGSDRVNGIEMWSFHTLNRNFTSQGVLNTSSTFSADIKHHYAQANGKLFFYAKHEDYGLEPWALDLETNNIEQVKDIRSGSQDSYYHTGAADKMLAVDEEFILIPANDGVTGSAIWKTDGTEENTTMLIDLNDRGPYGFHTNLTRLGDKIVFHASTVAEGHGLWETDGTIEGTKFFKRIIGQIGLESVTFNNVMFFSASDGTHGSELWKSDGTTEGTFMITDANRNGNLNPKDFMILNENILLFSGQTDEHGIELWKYDQRTEKVELVKDVNRGSEGCFLRPMFKLKGEYYFTAYTKEYGGELWKTDGTTEGTIILKDINPGKKTGVTTLGIDGVANEEFGFFPADSPRLGQELWITDGTTEGTHLIKDVFEGNQWASPFALTKIGDGKNIIFTAHVENASNSYRIFMTDGTAENTFDITEKMSYPGAPYGFIIIEDKIYFGGGGTDTGRELFQMPIEVCERAEMNFDDLTEGGIYKALDRVTLSKKTDDNSSVVVKAGFEVVLEEGFETADDGWLTINIEECIEEENSEEEEVEEREEEVNNFNLTAAPNPFTNLTNIQYQLSERSEANLLLFTAQGQLARSILSTQTLEAGNYTATLNAGDLEAGLYFLILQTAKEKVVRKLVVVK